MQTDARVKTAKRNVQLSCFTFNIPEWSCCRWDEGWKGEKEPDSADPVNCGIRKGLTESVFQGREGGKEGVSVCCCRKGGVEEKAESIKGGVEKKQVRKQACVLKAAAALKAASVCVWRVWRVSSHNDVTVMANVTSESTSADNSADQQIWCVWLHKLVRQCEIGFKNSFCKGVQLTQNLTELQLKLLVS